MSQFTPEQIRIFSVAYNSPVTEAFRVPTGYTRWIMTGMPGYIPDAVAAKTIVTSIDVEEAKKYMNGGKKGAN